MENLNVNYMANSGQIGLTEQPTEAVTFSQIGQQSRTISAERLRNTPKVYLQKWTEGVPIISGVWIGNLDVMNYPVMIYAGDATELTLEAEID